MPAAIADNTNSTPMTTTTANPELRHVTSNTTLPSPPKENRVSKRTSQHLRTHRLGSRSPSSIPSSPTSVHSSSSAIFERDIEPITPSPPLYGHPVDPHRIPRGKLSEQLDQSVPTVLDSAAEILTSDGDDRDVLDSIAIVAPLSLESFGPGSGFTSPISQLSSRSPSPSATNRRSLLVNLPSPSPSFTLPLPITATTSAGAQSSGSPPTRPIVQTSAPPPPAVQTPSISTPTSAYFSVTSEDSSPTTATHHEHPLHSFTAPGSPTTPGPTSAAPTASAHAPPSPKNPSKRLSFISYTDLLTSAPATAMPLSSLTLSAQANEPPPHLSSVIGIPQAHAHGQSSSAASVHGSMSLSSAWVTERDPATDLVNDVGGEWEREGLGRGLEERLEALMTQGNQNVLGQKA